LSTQLTEEAAKLRANAASSIIKSEMDLKEIEREFASFQIKSDTSDNLADRELKLLLGLGERVSKLLQQVSTSIPSICSAGAACIYPLNVASKITPVIDDIDAAKGYAKETETKFAEFKNQKKFVDQKSALVNAQGKINQTLAKIRSAVDQSHLLTFGQ